MIQIHPLINFFHFFPTLYCPWHNTLPASSLIDISSTSFQNRIIDFSSRILRFRHMLTIVGVDISDAPSSPTIRWREGTIDHSIITVICSDLRDKGSRTGLHRQSAHAGIWLPEQSSGPRGNSRTASGNPEVAAILRGLDLEIWILPWVFGYPCSHSWTGNGLLCPLISPPPNTSTWWYNTDARTCALPCEYVRTRGLYVRRNRSRGIQLSVTISTRVLGSPDGSPEEHLLSQNAISLVVKNVCGEGGNPGSYLPTTPLSPIFTYTSLLLTIKTIRHPGMRPSPG